MAIIHKLKNGSESRHTCSLVQGNVCSFESAQAYVYSQNDCTELPCSISITNSHVDVGTFIYRVLQAGLVPSIC